MSLQNDFECIRPLPWKLIVDALSHPEVACVKLWDRTKGRRIAGPKVRLLRRARWRRSDKYSEPVTVARTGWGYGPQAVKAHVACRVVRKARKEIGMMQQAVRLGKLVVRPEALSFRHIGNVKTPHGIYRSKRRFTEEVL